MKTILFLFVSLSFYTYSNAQYNRRNSKKTIAYSTTYQRMASGCSASHSFEIRNGNLWAWGNNSDAQLGDSTTTQRNSPWQTGTDSKWLHITCGNKHTLGLKADGTLWAWGNNSYGQLGDSTTTNRLSPKQIGTGNSWISISAGGNHSVGLKADGTVWTWGNNNYGQLGDGTTTQKITPQQLGTDNHWVSICAGYNHTLALKADGTLWSWGANANGQLGDSTTVSRNSPVKISGVWVSIFAGDSFTICLKSNGRISGWGNNNYGQLGIGTTTSSLYPVQIGNDSNWVNIAAGGNHTVGLRSNGTLWSWGSNNYGQLGDSTTTNHSSPAQIGTGSNWVGVLSGENYSMGMKSNGTLLSWGDNSSGQLGDGTNAYKISPVQILKNNQILTVTGGGFGSFSVKSNGTLWAWGWNVYGNLGDSTQTDRLAPVQIGTDSNWVTVVTSQANSYGIKSDGTLWSWGYNSDGQLGNGTASIYYPIQVGTDRDWVAVTPGMLFAHGLKSNGTIWGWGINDQGQVGDGTTTRRFAPVRIGNDNRWVSISGTGRHTLALKSNGTLWAWGRNVYGELGIGSVTNVNASPVQIGSDSDWVSIFGGYFISLAIKSNGTLWAWGYNYNGQVGDSTTTNRTSPVQIGTDNKWITLAAGIFHSYGKKVDGKIWAWGLNTYGSLGDGTTTSRNFPVVIGGSNWLDIQSGDDHFLALKSDRKEYCVTGLNTYGAFGNFTTQGQFSFVCNTVCQHPAANPGGNKSICLGYSTTIGSNPVNGNSYSWYSSPSGFTSNIANPTVSPTTTTTFFLTETVIATGCSRTNSVNVFVNSLPNVNVGTNKTICEGSSTTIGLTAVSGHAYLWSSVPPGFYSAIAKPTVSPAVTTWYHLKETFTPTGCFNFDSVLVTVRQRPDIITDSVKLVCKYDSITIGKVAVNGNTYSWTSSPVGFTSTLSNPKVSPTLNTKYFLLETDTAYGCIRKDTVRVTVNPVPNAFVGQTRYICVGQSTTVGFLPVSGSSYSWTSSPSGFTSTVSKPTVSPTTTTVYYLTETIIATGCSKTNAVTVNVYNYPTAISGKDSTICKGISVNIGAPPVSGSNYSWTSNPVGFSSTLANPSVSPAITTTYYLKETLVNSGCSSTDSVTITVLPLPMANTGADKSICPGSSTNIGDTSITGHSYSWISKPSGFISSLSNPSVQPTVTTIYYLTEQNQTNGCSSTDSVMVTVNLLPAANAGSDKAICEGSSIGIGSALVNGQMYSWFSIPAGFSSTSPNPSVNPLVTTTYYLTVTDSITGCFNSDTANVIVNVKPKAYTGGNKAICKGESISIGGVTVAGNNYSWTSSPSGFTSLVSNPTVSPASTTKYYLTETNALTGCFNLDSLVVTVHNLPDAFVGSGKTICNGEKIQLGDSPVNGHTYNWSSLPAGFNALVANPMVSPVVTTKYYLTETVTASSCSKTDSITIIVKPIPNISTLSNGATIIAQQNNASYQWLNCPAYSVIQGETNKNFTAIADGDYAVRIDLNGCIDTSDCTTIKLIGIGIKNRIMEEVLIYPNPNNGVFNIKSNNKASFTIINELGQIIRQFTLNDVNNKQIAIENLSSGVYYLTGISDKDNSVFSRNKIVVIN